MKVGWQVWSYWSLWSKRTVQRSLKKYKHWFVFVLQLLGISLNGQIFFKLLIHVTFKIVWVRRYSRQNVFSSYSHKSNEQTIQSHMPLSNSVVCIVEVFVVYEQLGRHRSMKYNSLWALALNLYIKSLIQLMNILSISSSDTMK